MNGGDVSPLTPLDARKQWLCFNDDEVRKANLTDVFEANFGPGGNTNAYVLTFINRSVIEGLITPTVDVEHPTHLRVAYEKAAAQEQLMKRQLEEGSQKLSVHLIFAEDIYSRVDKSNDNLYGYVSISRDTEQLNKTRGNVVVTIRKSETIGYAIAALHKAVQEQQKNKNSDDVVMSLWAFDYHQGNFSKPLVADDPGDLVGDIFHVGYTTIHQQEAIAEVLVVPCRRDTVAGSVLVHVKYFDPVSTSAVYLGPAVLHHAFEVERFLHGKISAPNHDDGAKYDDRTDEKQNDTREPAFIVEKYFDTSSTSTTTSSTTTTTKPNTSERNGGVVLHSTTRPSTDRLDTQGVRNGDVIFASYYTRTKINGVWSTIECFPSASAYALHTKKKRVLSIRMLDKPDICVGLCELLTDNTYSEVQTAVAKMLGKQSVPMEAESLRFWVDGVQVASATTPTSPSPPPKPRKRCLYLRDHKSLVTMITPSATFSYGTQPKVNSEVGILYVENLAPYRLVDLDGAHVFRFDLCLDRTTRAVSTHILVLPSRCTIGDVFSRIREHYGSLVESIEKLRVLEVYLGKIYNGSVIVEGEDSTQLIPTPYNEINLYRVEPVPRMIPDLDPNQQLRIDCFHFTFQQYSASGFKSIVPFGQPFTMYIALSDTALEARTRAVRDVLALLHQDDEEGGSVPTWGLYIVDPTQHDNFALVADDKNVVASMEPINRHRSNRTRALTIGFLHNSSSQQQLDGDKNKKGPKRSSADQNGTGSLSKVSSRNVELKILS